MSGAAFARLRRTLGAPVDPASFVVFRIGFGLIAAFAALRYIAYGWVDTLLLEPTFHFAWAPFFVMPRRPVLYGLFVVQALAGLAIAARLWPRTALVLWLLSFGYVEMLDKTLYLNHYVLFSLLGATLAFTPVHRVALSGGPALPQWVLWLLRAEFGLVWFWAGLAKLNTDWLFRAEPLLTWLQARRDLPVVGEFLAWDPTAWLMSWGGAAYDLAIPFLLLHPRTRVVGMALLLGFHVTVGFVFPIGIFPAVMILGGTVFLEPDWPRRLIGGRATPSRGTPLSRPATLAWVGMVALLALFPARFLLYGTDVSWSERGYRFSWRVLLNEKTGLVDYRVVERSTRRTWRVRPTPYLTALQHKQMRTQPDMIRDFALHLADQHAAEGRDVAVYADSWVSLNGRPSQRYLRPDLDLTQPVWRLERDAWILPMED